MKKYLIFTLAIFGFFSAEAQTGGFVTINDFGLPNNPHQFTRFWKRGSIPAGSNPIIDFFGQDNVRFYQDSISSTTLHLKEASPYKLLTIDANGVFGAYTPSYLLPADTSGKWVSLGTPISAFANDAGYLTGITSSDVTSALGYTPGNVSTSGSYSDPTWITSLSQSKISYSGSTSQYIRGDGSLATFPSIPSITSPSTYYHNGSLKSDVKVMTFTATVSGSGNATVYLTDNGISGGNAVFSDVYSVTPFVNDASDNYCYQYSLSGDKKTLTVNAKSSSAVNVALLGLSLLGAPMNVPNGTTIHILVVGN